MEILIKINSLWSNTKTMIRKLKYLVLYALYLILVSLFLPGGFLNNLLQGFIGKSTLAYQLEFVTIASSIITLLVLQWAIGKIENLTFTIIIVSGAFILADMKLSMLRAPPESNLVEDRSFLYFLFALVVSIVLLAFDIVKWKRQGEKDRKVIIFGADIPLFLGLTFVFIYAIFSTNSGAISKDNVSLFLGGALTFKIGYYYSAYCLLKTFFVPATTNSTNTANTQNESNR